MGVCGERGVDGRDAESLRVVVMLSFCDCEWLSGRGARLSFEAAGAVIIDVVAGVIEGLGEFESLKVGNGA